MTDLAPPVPRNSLKDGRELHQWRIGLTDNVQTLLSHTANSNVVANVANAYAQANVALLVAEQAYAQANAAANTVTIYVDEAVVAVASNINFQNSNTINVYTQLDTQFNYCNVSFSVNAAAIVATANIVNAFWNSYTGGGC